MINTLQKCIAITMLNTFGPSVLHVLQYFCNTIIQSVIFNFDFAISKIKLGFYHFHCQNMKHTFFIHILNIFLIHKIKHCQQFPNKIVVNVLQYFSKIVLQFAILNTFSEKYCITVCNTEKVLQYSIAVQYCIAILFQYCRWYCNTFQKMY